MSAAKRPEWRGEEFEAFLARLDPSRDQAALAYERLRRKLIVFFLHRLGSVVDVEELADTSLDRAIQKFSGDAGSAPRDIQPYALGIARNVLMEYRKKPQTDPLDTDPPDPRPSIEEEADLRMRCLRHCLTRLSDEDRQLVLAYHGYGKNETAAVDKSRVAQRVRVYRIRRNLQQCVERCINALSSVTVSKPSPDNHMADRRKFYARG